MLAWFLTLDFIYQLIFAFCAGMIFNYIIMIFIMFTKNKKIGAYQRQLEKQSVSSDENFAKVKVLESKIQVLEKALETALNK